MAYCPNIKNSFETLFGTELNNRLDKYRHYVHVEWVPASTTVHQVSSAGRQSQSGAIFVGRALGDPERTLIRPVINILPSFAQELKLGDSMAGEGNPKHRSMGNETI